MSRTALRPRRPRRRTPAQERYRALLSSPRWRALRRRVLARDAYRCMRCGATKALQVHHTAYATSGLPWDVPLRALVTLCRGCHKRAHRKA